MEINSLEIIDNKIMPETILVTGATGTVGSEVVKQLVSSSLGKNDIIIKAAIHSQNRADNFIQYNKSIQTVNVDYNRPETLADALNQVDRLFLLTLPSPDMTVYSNLVKEIRKYHDSINHIVKLSSMAAYDEETGFATTIGRIHREEEKIIEESGIPFTFLRPPAFMQNFITQFGYTIRTQDAFYVPGGDAKLSFIDARDVAAVAVKALTGDSQQHTGKSYTITAEEAISYRQAAEILSKEAGRRISYVDIPEQNALKGMKESGMHDWLIEAIMEFYSIIKAGHASKTTNVFEQVMSRKAISFSQFARDYAQAFK
ncbi:MAG TPA: SDR family oxidoreductase [Nitrososphaeraceae archaeon]|nr:SDR family oxidoreductase [Nitrososphaeraceae archaeon]